MSEAVQGSYSFSILDEHNTLTLVKGDSPITLLHFPHRKLYIYASTDKILYQALIDTTYFDDVKKGLTEEIKLICGDIWQVSPNGNTTTTRFIYNDYVFGGKWYDYNTSYSRVSTTPDKQTNDDTWLKEIKSICKWYGYTPEEIDELYYDYGYSCEELEQLIYDYSYNEL